MWEQENIWDLESMCSEKLYVNLETVLMELNNDSNYVLGPQVELHVQK